MLHSLCTATNKTRRRSLSVFVTEKQTGEVDGAAGKHWPLHANFFWQEATVLNRFISERKQRDYRVNRKLQGQISLQKNPIYWEVIGKDVVGTYYRNMLKIFVILIFIQKEEKKVMLIKSSTPGSVRWLTKVLLDFTSCFICIRTYVTSFWPVSGRVEMSLMSCCETINNHEAGRACAGVTQVSAVWRLGHVL